MPMNKSARTVARIIMKKSTSLEARECDFVVVFFCIVLLLNTLYTYFSTVIWCKRK